MVVFFAVIVVGCSFVLNTAFSWYQVCCVPERRNRIPSPWAESQIKESRVFSRGRKDFYF